MNQEPQDDLDKLLARAPLPQAPAWFETRLMARLRREESQRLEPWWLKLRRHAVVLSASFAVAILLAATGIGLVRSDKVSLASLSSTGTNYTSNSYAKGNHSTGKDETVFAALDAFVSYQQDNSLWSDDLQ